jgi:hypothetical protein
MLGSSPAARFAVERTKAESRPYLDSHRALAACSREFARLAEDVVNGVAALHAAGVQDEPQVRLSPGRCIVQVGPVALTLAWLRSTLGSVTDGQLLAIVWEGTVAPRAEHHPERTATRPPPRPATALWEEVFSAVAASEASWTWQPARADVGGYSSTDLAARCVERLGRAHAESSVGV